METNQDISTLPPPPPPPARASSEDPSAARSRWSAAPSSEQTARSAASPTGSPSEVLAKSTPSPELGRKTVVAVGVDHVADAHRYAHKLALAHTGYGRSVAHLVADPANVLISVAPNPDAPQTSVYDLSRAVEEIETPDGRLLRVAVGGLMRLELADIVESVSGVVDHVVISGPLPALSQQTLEFATIADYGVVVGGSTTDANHVAHILDQLQVANHWVAAEQSVRKIAPPGAL